MLFGFEPKKIRKDFPILEREYHGKKITYFDNSATSLKPIQVLDAEKNYYQNSCANVHRGLHLFSEEASREYEDAHRVTAKFFGSNAEEVIFTRNSTEALNLIAYSMLNSGMIKKGDKIVSTILEHHSNMLPWRIIAQRIGAHVEIVGLTKNYCLDYDELEKKSKGAKVIAISAASNTIGYITDLKRISEIAKKNGAYFVVDGAQLAPHREFNFKKSNADFFAFSGHKMLASTGTGALIGKKELLQKMEPFLVGGGMNNKVTLNSAEWAPLPEKFEAGTPHIAGAYGLKAALNYLSSIGMKNIEKHEKELTKLALEEVSKIPGIKMFCPMDAEKQCGIILFESNKLNAHDLSMALSESESIFIRSGMHCAEPLVSSLNKDGLARASFYIYNTKEEVLNFVEALKRMQKLY
jgi:cysteine desulfurase/selenocysteine lyase